MTSDVFVYDAVRTPFGLESGHHLGRHASAVLHVDSLHLRPLAHFSGIQPARRLPAATRAGRRALPLPPGIDIARQCVPQCPGILGVQVDLILRAVEPEADGALRLAAIEVIDEQGLLHNSG